MKPAPFVYHAPETLGEALAVLAEVGHDGKILAGGQSLIPLLSMRLASPEHVVDINKITELAYVRVDGGVVRVGALARHAEVERDPAAREAQPLISQALRHVAHPVIRNRGTTLGSIVHADPSGEMPAVLAVLGGEIEVASTNGRRTISVEDLFAGPLECTLAPGELAIEARFPVAPDGGRSAFVELARRHGDYAMCGVALVVQQLDDELVAARAAYCSMAATPVVIDLLESVRSDASSGSPGPARWSGVAAYVQDQLDPDGDIHVTADYRRHLAGALTRRALDQVLPRQGAEAVA